MFFLKKIVQFDNTALGRIILLFFHNFVEENKFQQILGSQIRHQIRDDYLFSYVYRQSVTENDNIFHIWSRLILSLQPVS